MVFGRKARLLDDLITHSDDNRKQKLLEAFNKIRAAKRDIIAHSYHGSNELSVQYVERNTSGRFKANVNTYTFNEFKQYVHKFYIALDASETKKNAFANAAFSLNRKSDTSPESPTESK